MTAQTLRLLLFTAAGLLLLCIAGTALALFLLARANNAAGGGRYPTQIDTPGTVDGVGNITAIAAGADHSLALDADGAVWAWGANQYGQLGVATGKDCGGNALNAVACSHTPRRVPGLGPVRAVAAGGNHSLALTTDGAAWAWGWNQSGQLGDGTVADRLAPARVPGLANITALAGGGGHSLALDADGVVWQWGTDLAGAQTCQPPGWSTGYLCNLAPTRVGGLPAIAAIAAASGYNLALASDGTVWSWGRNEFGQLGSGTVADQPTPAPIANLGGIAALAAGRYHALALTATGDAWGWGDNTYGQIGIASRDTCQHPSASGITNPCSLTPVPLRAQGDLSALAAGDGRTLLLARDGTVRRLGYTDPDRNGFGSAADACELTPPTRELAHCHAQPTLIPDLTNVVAIAAGERHFLALAPDRANNGTVHAWGDNYHGQSAR
jgi:alpha-tubulin suppressor-like RCC1 family protein